MTTGLGKMIGLSSAIQNSYEQDSNTTSTPTATIFGSYPVTVAERVPHLRTHSESSNSSSAPSSPNTATSPISVSPTAFASFLLPSLFSGTTSTARNMNQSNVTEEILAPPHTRRSSQSDAGDKQLPRYIMTRRYTMPSIDVGSATSNEKSQSGGLRRPFGRFWEEGGKEDSSVQVAMEHVQFGA